MEGIFSITSVKTYNVLSISYEQKVFYVQDIDYSDDFFYFPILDVAIKDLHLLILDATIIRSEGYVDDPEGIRYHVSKIEFKEAVKDEE